MRMFSILRFVSLALAFCSGLAVRVFEVSTEIIMAPLRAGYGNAYRFVERYVLSAFRLIGMLKPEYDDSMETNGQSLFGMPRVLGRC